MPFVQIILIAFEITIVLWREFLAPHGDDAPAAAEKVAEAQT